MVNFRLSVKPFYPLLFLIVWIRIHIRNTILLNSDPIWIHSPGGSYNIKFLEKWLFNFQFQVQIPSRVEKVPVRTYFDIL